MKRRTDSASSRSCSAVEPTRSAKTIVTTLRAAASSTALAAREPPQASQNWASGLPSAPHAGQRRASDLPQPPQNRAPAPCALPQLPQFMTTSSFDRSRLPSSRADPGIDQWQGSWYCFCHDDYHRRVGAAGGTEGDPQAGGYPAEQPPGSALSRRPDRDRAGSGAGSARAQGAAAGGGRAEGYRAPERRNRGENTARSATLAIALNAVLPARHELHGRGGVRLARSSCARRDRD